MIKKKEKQFSLIRWDIIATIRKRKTYYYFYIFEMEVAEESNDICFIIKIFIWI